MADKRIIERVSSDMPEVLAIVQAPESAVNVSRRCATEVQDEGVG